MDYNTDIRVEKFMTKGGGGSLAFGTIVNSDLRAKYSSFADSIVIKTITIPAEVSEEKALAQFYQEVAVMQFPSFLHLHVGGDNLD